MTDVNVYVLRWQLRTRCQHDSNGGIRAPCGCRGSESSRAKCSRRKLQHAPHLGRGNLPVCWCLPVRTLFTTPVARMMYNNTTILPLIFHALCLLIRVCLNGGLANVSTGATSDWTAFYYIHSFLRSVLIVEESLSLTLGNRHNKQTNKQTQVPGLLRCVRRLWHHALPRRPVREHSLLIEYSSLNFTESVEVFKSKLL